jgi:peptide deformylase
VAVRPVLQLPAPVLSRPARSIGRVDSVARALAVDLVDTMGASPGCVGLAAPQIGVPLRAFAVDVTGHRKANSGHGRWVLFDPRLVAAALPVIAREGCMSVPALTGDVSRAEQVTVQGLTLEGGSRVIEVDGFEARAVLHELDHLDGVLFLDRVASPAAMFLRKVYRSGR